VPLVIVPASRDHPGFKDILVLICQHGSPLEVLLALEECLIPDHPNNENDDDDDGEPEPETPRLDHRKVLLALEMYALCTKDFIFAQ
jgi:hypothetical protein